MTFGLSKCLTVIEQIIHPWEFDCRIIWLSSRRIDNLDIVFEKTRQSCCSLTVWLLDCLTVINQKRHHTTDDSLIDKLSNWFENTSLLESDRLTVRLSDCHWALKHPHYSLTVCQFYCQILLLSFIKTEKLKIRHPSTVWQSDCQAVWLSLCWQHRTHPFYSLTVWFVWNCVLLSLQIVLE